MECPLIKLNKPGLVVQGFWAKVVNFYVTDWGYFDDAFILHTFNIIKIIKKQAFIFLAKLSHYLLRSHTDHIRHWSIQDINQLIR